MYSVSNEIKSSYLHANNIDVWSQGSHTEMLQNILNLTQKLHYVAQPLSRDVFVRYMKLLISKRGVLLTKNEITKNFEAISEEWPITSLQQRTEILDPLGKHLLEFTENREYQLFRDFLGLLPKKAQQLQANLPELIVEFEILHRRKSQYNYFIKKEE